MRAPAPHLPSRVFFSTRILPCAAALLCLGTLVWDRPPQAASALRPKAEVGQLAPDFSLRDHRGRTHTLSDYRRSVVVLEWIDASCSKAQELYEDNETLANLRKAHANQGIVWLAIDTSRQRSSKRLAEWQAKAGFSQPALQDPKNKVAYLYSIRRSPHFSVIDRTGILRYAGPLTNSASVVAATRALVRDDPKAVPAPTRAAGGCAVQLPR